MGTFIRMSDSFREQLYNINCSNKQQQSLVRNDKRQSGIKEEDEEEEDLFIFNDTLLSHRTHPH